MARDLLQMADDAWTGVMSVEDANPVAGPSNLSAEVADGTLFLHSFANVIAVDGGDGLAMVDAGAPFMDQMIHGQIRQWRPDAALRTAVYTHGHIDHVFAVPRFDAEAADRGWDRPHVVAHRAVPDRFDRYVLTAGYNAAINRRQFGVDDLAWPVDYRYPDETYDANLAVTVGDARAELRHSRGETDDHTWVWMPATKTLCTGDLFIWCVPNAGNPQKAPRYCREWEAALRQMADLGAETLLPGHGFPIIGADRVRQALVDTADLLGSIHDQTVALMNDGLTLDEVIGGVVPPADLLERPYLRPVYDDPEFVVRNIWRLYGGWYDGQPSSLKPAPVTKLAGELADLAGGASKLADRAAELLAVGDDPSLRLAAHLADLAAHAAPTDSGVAQVRAAVYRARVAAEPSLMAKGVFGAARRESEKPSS